MHVWIQVGRRCGQSARGKWSRLRPLITWSWKRLLRWHWRFASTWYRFRLGSNHWEKTNISCSWMYTETPWKSQILGRIHYKLILQETWGLPPDINLRIGNIPTDRNLIETWCFRSGNMGYMTWHDNWKPQQKLEISIIEIQDSWQFLVWNPDRN